MPSEPEKGPTSPALEISIDPPMSAPKGGPPKLPWETSQAGSGLNAKSRDTAGATRDRLDLREVTALENPPSTARLQQPAAILAVQANPTDSVQARPAKVAVSATHRPASSNNVEVARAAPSQQQQNTIAQRWIAIALGAVICMAGVFNFLRLRSSNDAAAVATTPQASKEPSTQATPASPDPATLPSAPVPAVEKPIPVATDAPPEKVTRGPHGEAIHIGGDGLGTDWFFHYFLDKDGKKVMHGNSRVLFNGKGIQESSFDNDVLQSRVRFDANKNVEEVFKRLPDGTYERHEYRILTDGATLHMQSVVSIEISDDSETIKEIQKRFIVPDSKPLPAIPGRRLQVNIGTAGSDEMAWFVKNHNASLSAVSCVATEDQLIIDFDVDASQWVPVQKTFPLLVRLFDRNGEHLTHFTTAEGFTVFLEVYGSFDPIYRRMKDRVPDEAVKYKCAMLKPKCNRYVYGVNIRDLRDASILEIGFTDRR